MTKMGDILGNYTPLADGMELVIQSVEFEDQEYGGKPAHLTRIIDPNGKVFSTWSEVIYKKLNEKKIQEVLANGQTIECKCVEETTEKGNRKYLNLI